MTPTTVGIKFQVLLFSTIETLGPDDALVGGNLAANCSISLPPIGRFEIIA
jgi:hypothetical protein